jgi:hypothetical protein
VTWRPARGVVRYLRSRRGAGERAVAGTGAVEPDWRALADDLVGRVRALGAVEGVGFRLALTGGKDSRLVLAALCAAGLVDRVDHAYLKAAEGHADVAVGRAIAARAGVAFRRYDAPVAGFGAEVLARHIALTGGMLGAWDLKAHQAVPRHVGLHGGYGEIYKSHALHFAHLARLGALGAMGADAVGWKLAARHYQHPRWIDPFGLMHARPAAKLAAVYADWLDARRAAGQPLADLHDAWHRGCRMRRWLGQSLQAGAALAPMVNPLGSYALLDAYLALPLRDRIDHRMHFELFEAIDPALGRAPFAGDRWARRLLRDAARTKSVESSSQSSSLSGQGSRPAPPAPQRAFAARHHGVIAAALADRADDGFYDVFKRAAVAGMVARAAGGRASHREIEAVLALWTARAVLRGGFEPVQVVFDAAAE